MLAYTYVEHGKFELRDKPRPVLRDARDAIVRVTLASICTSDLHIKHGSVPRAVPGITVGHEMVGIVDEVGEAVTAVRPGDRVTVNVETFCGDCFFCRNGWVNNCTDPEGGWALGCRIDGGQAEYVRVPYADQGLNRIPDGVTDRQALFVGDVLATGYWAARIAEIRPGDTVLILGAGPTGLCTLQCVQLLQPGRIIVCDRDPGRLAFVRAHAPQVLAVPPEGLPEVVRANSRHGGADAVLEVAGSPDTFRLAWECARPNAVVTVVALMAQGLVDESFRYHLTTAKKNGITKEEIAEVVTHAAASFHQLHLLLVEPHDGPVGVGVAVDTDDEAVGERGHLIIVADARHRTARGDDEAEVVEQRKDFLFRNRVGVFALNAGHLASQAVVHVGR